jgi:hypothetical protein
MTEDDQMRLRDERRLKVGEEIEVQSLRTPPLELVIHESWHRGIVSAVRDDGTATVELASGKTVELLPDIYGSWRRLTS